MEVRSLTLAPRHLLTVWQEAEDATARALWKKDFIKETMSVRAQYGAMSVAEAVAKDEAQRRKASGEGEIEEVSTAGAAALDDDDASDVTGVDIEELSEEEEVRTLHT